MNNGTGKTYNTEHWDLCKLTAQRFLKDSHIVLWEYQSFATGEFPDVLCFDGSETTLYEIKVTRSDFLADSKKDSRKKYKPKCGLSARDLTLKALPPELYYIEAPHLGVYRYFVTPYGMVQKDELPDGWGLYWVKNGKFFKQQTSKKFRRNLFDENALLVHALRKLGNGIKDEKVLIREYK